jgi:SOS-response transcriptional repressor LexA
MENLTKKQQRVLDYISKRLSAGDCPSQRQIASHLGISQNAVFQLVRYLKNKGFLRSEKGHRGLKLSGSYLQQGLSDRIPVMGCAMTGEESRDKSPVKRFINSSSVFGKTAGMFFVRVSGNVLSSVGILDSDYVLVKPGSDVGDGQIAIVLIDDKIWLRQVCVSDGRTTVFIFTTRSGKNNRQRIELKTADIVGRAIGLIRLPFADN